MTMQSRSLKILSIALLCALSSAFAPKKAEAGLLIGALAGNPGAGMLIGGALGVAVTSVAAIKQCDREADCAATILLIVGLPAVGAGVLLDVDSAALKNGSEAYVRKAFPMIDSQDVIADLGSLVSEKLQGERLARGEQKTLVLPEASVRSALASSSLSGAQIEGVVNGLCR